MDGGTQQRQRLHYSGWEPTDLRCPYHKSKRPGTRRWLRKFIWGKSRRAGRRIEHALRTEPDPGD